MIGLGLKLALAAGLALGIGIAGARIVNLIVDGRVSKATEAINQDQRDAADAISEARARVRACHLGGGLWDRSTGQCVRPVPGAGQ